MAESPTVARARGILDALGDVHDEIPGADPLGDADHVPQRDPRGHGHASHTRRATTAAAA